MTAAPCTRVRDATPADAAGVAALHADSWRRNYRGAFSDAFLDGDVGADRLALWSARMERPAPGCTLVAEEATGALTGFVHVVFDDDPSWGALVDNLHVEHGAARRGTGRLLMGEAARRVLAHDPASGLYLWVLEQNATARAFYGALGGLIVQRRPAVAPGGVPGRLTGEPMALRCAWADPGRLLAGAGGAGPRSDAGCEAPGRALGT